jgi:NADPH-dependent ferric siderophore reductase
VTERFPLPPPEPLHDGPLAGTHRWTFAVVDAEALSPGLRRLRLIAPDLDLLHAQPGQDLMVAVPTGAADGSETAPTINRRYSIRAVESDGDRPVVVVDVVLHGSGPGSRWAADAAPGDVVVAVGPRGKVVPVSDARAHLFVADPSGTPASLCMLESLPAGAAHAVLVVDSPAERQPTTASPEAVTWVHGSDPEEVDVAIAAAAAARPTAQAYLAGERADVARWRSVLEAAGMSGDRVKWKAYWSRSAANAAHGEPARDG